MDKEKICKILLVISLVVNIILGAKLALIPEIKPPTVQTMGATYESKSVWIRGEIIDSGNEYCTCWFEYFIGGNYTIASMAGEVHYTSPESGAIQITSAWIDYSDLKSGAIYSYRFCASNGAYISHGEWMHFSAP
jgi:hypothetical protein